MILYSKLFDMITGKNKFELNCKIKDLYGLDDNLLFIRVETESESECLVYIDPSKYKIGMENKKFNILTRWEKMDETEPIIISDSDLTVVRKIKAYSSPTSLIDFVSRLKLSVKSTSCKIGILSEEYLMTALEDDDLVHVFHVKGPKETKLLIVTDLESFLFKNTIPIIDRVYKNVLKMLQEINESYWNSLLELLEKCKKIKVVTKGKTNAKSTNPIDQNVKLATSHTAIKIALEHFEN